MDNGTHRIEFREPRRRSRVVTGSILPARLEVTVMVKVIVVGAIVICAAILFGYASAAAMSTVIGQSVIALIVGLVLISGFVERQT